jgi:hypothetical protein
MKAQIPAGEIREGFMRTFSCSDKTGNDLQ